LLPAERDRLRQIHPTAADRIPPGVHPDPKRARGQFLDLTALPAAAALDEWHHDALILVALRSTRLH
jgi:hypothetical protein